MTTPGELPYYATICPLLERGESPPTQEAFFKNSDYTYARRFQGWGKLIGVALRAQITWDCSVARHEMEWEGDRILGVSCKEDLMKGSSC